MHVVATAGHVDHGKSTLVRALTGMEPDRWAEERLRGMTIDLGYAWMRLADGQTVAFVDVPGHARFVQNMLAGIGPVPAVVLVLAADEGWMPQTEEHFAAVAALGVSHGLLVVTKADLADPAPALDAARRRCRGTPFAGVDSLAVSAATGAGMAELAAALSRLAASLPAADADAPPRLWVDRSFTIRGAGTVVTGTLTAGTVRIGDELVVAPAGRTVRIRGLQTLGTASAQAGAVARVALNLRGVEPDAVRRGDALVAAGTWRPATRLDVSLDRPLDRPPGELTVHCGSAAVPARCRLLDPRRARLVRLTLGEPLPARVGDRLLLRDPGGHLIVAGAVVLDPDPPALSRRGAAAERARELASSPESFQAADELRRRGYASRQQLAGYAGCWPDRLDPPPEARWVGELLVSEAQLDSWAGRLLDAVRAHRGAHPLEPGPAEEEARRVAGLPRSALPAVLARLPGLESVAGRLVAADAPAGLPAPAAAAVGRLTDSLRSAPFAAAEAGGLAELGLDRATLSAAVRLGLLLRLGGIYLLPDAPQRALSTLARLEQPFTVSEARSALDTTRRVAVPLLEHLDATGGTRRLDAVRRVVVGAGA